MTTRKTLFLDRLATLVLAAVLLAGGLAALWWWSGRSIQGTTLPETTSTSAALDLADTAWVGWAAAAVGVLLALVGLRWIVAHLTGAKVKRLRLAGTDTSGRLEAAAGKVVDAAADAFADTDGVRSARGSVVKDRGQLVARVDATVEPEADLALLARRADETSAQLLAVLGRDDLRCTVNLRTALRGRALTRAH